MQTDFFCAAVVSCGKMMGGNLYTGGNVLELLREVIQVYFERKEWFWELILQHITISAIAILLAGVIGLLIGMWIAEHDWISPVILGVANVFYTIPSISLLGMLIPFIGIGDKTAVVALTIYGIMPMVRNTYAGIKGVDEDIITAARGMGSTDFQIMTKIKLPLALGVIIAGIRNMVVMTISVAAIASFIGAGGLGVAIYRGITLYNTSLTFGGSFLIALLALVSDLLIGLIEKKIKKKGRF